MGVQQTKDVVLRFYEEVFNGRRLETFDELVADDTTDHSVPPGYENDKPGSRSAVTGYLAAFPDLKLVIEDVIASEDHVAIRARWSGTNDGPLIGFGPPLPATAVASSSRRSRSSASATASSRTTGSSRTTWVSRRSSG